MNPNNELTKLLTEYREEHFTHRTRLEENQFYNLIATGNIKAIRPMTTGPINEQLFEQEGYGILSKDRIRNARYHFVTAVALITRICAEKGLPAEVAYTMSDLYINKMDRLNSLDEIIRLNSEMALAFTTKMAELRKEQVYSLPVIKAMDYIIENLNSSVNVNQVAEALHMNRSYLSTLFANETKLSLSDYIRKEKISFATHLLQYTDYSYSIIADYLAFSSQSHFIQTFRKEIGMTPAEYRKQKYNQTSVLTESPNK